MGQPHKWAKEIHAWADGAAIEGKNIDTGEWVEIEPYWETDDEYEYRIKSQPSEPQPKEPQYLKVFKINNTNIKFVEDGGYIEHNSDYIEYLGKIKLETDDD